jgi:autotransporter-associated beta strand protein
MKKHGAGVVRSLIATISMLLLASAGTIWAAPKTWSGGSGSDSQWTTAGNWVGGVAVAAADTVVYDAYSAARLTDQTLGASINIGGLTLTAPVGPVTILPGNTLTLGTAGLDLSAALWDLTLGCGVSLGATQSWNVNTGRTLTVSGPINGASVLTKTGAGTLVLSGTNTFSSGLVISNGTVRAARDAELGDASGSVTLTGGTLAVGQFYSARPLAINADSAINVARNFASIWNGPLTGSATLTLKGGFASTTSSQLSLINNVGNTFSGNIVVDTDGGTFKIGGNPYYAAGTALQGLILPNMTSANTITVRRGATFNIEDNVNGALGYVADRLGSSGNRPAVNLAGGTFNLNGANNAVAMTQTLGPLTLQPGPSVVNVTRAAGTPQLVFGSFARNSGGFVNFTGTALGTGTADGRILFTTPPVSVGGGGAPGTKTMSIVPGARSGNDLVYYSASGIRPLVAVTEYNEVTGANDINAVGATENVKMTGTTTPFTALTANRTINSLVITAAANATWTNGYTLTLTSGQFLSTPDNSRNIVAGVLTAGAGADTDLDMTIQQSTTTISGNINNNGSGAIALVKNGAGGLTLNNAIDNTYSGGTFVNEGTLTTGLTENRRYLGTGAVRVDGNAVLTLRNVGASGFTTANQATYTALPGGQVNIPNIAFAAASDRFDIRAGAILAASAAGTAGNGLNSLTRVAGLTGIAGGQAVLEPGSIVAFNVGSATALGVAPLALGSGAGTAGDLYFGLAVNNTLAGSTITVGAGTPWLGLSTDRSAKTILPGTITANSDFNLQGLGIPGVVPVGLTMGSAAGPVAINTPNGDVKVNVIGAVTWNSPSTALGSNGKNVTFVVNPGATFTLGVTNALGASPGSTVRVVVQAGGTLVLGVPNALNAAATIEAGGKLNANLAGGLLGTGALTCRPGSIVDVLTSATGFSGSQAAAATINPGTVVRLNIANFGSAVEPLDTYLATKSPIYATPGNWPINPVASNTTIMTLNKDANGAGGMLVNDGTTRDIAAVPNGVVVIGANGGAMAATTNTILTVRQAIALGANALTIGTPDVIDGLPPKLGTVTLGAPLGYNTATPGSSITVIPGATLSQFVDAIPDAADVTVNGTFTLGAAETIGSLAGNGAVGLVANALTVGRNNNSTTFSGMLTGSGAFTKTGTGRLDLTGDNTKLTHTGNLNVNEGILALSGAGKFSNNTGTITLNRGGTLTLDNSGTLTTGRIGTKAITMAGGTLSLVGNGAATTETVGAVTPGQGDSTISVSGGTPGNAATLVLTSAGTRAGGATLTFSGIDADNIIKYTAAPAMVNGVLPYGFVGNDFAVVANNTPITAYSAYNTGDLGLYAGGTANFSLSGAQTACNTKSVNSVKMTGGLGVTVNGGNTLTVTSGGIINDAGGNITGAGTIAAGTAVWTIQNTGAMTISSAMTGSAGMVKKGAGVLTLGSATTFAGATYIMGGTLAYGINDALFTQDLFVDGGATLDFANFDDTNLGNVSVKNGSIIATGATSANSISQAAAKTITLGAGPSGSSASINTGAGKWNMTGDLTFTATGDPNMATLAGNFSLNGATRTYTVGNSVAAGAAIDLDVPAVISGAAGFGLVKAGVGAMRLSNANTFDGPTTVTGTLILKNNQALGVPSTTRALTVSASSSLVLDGVGITDPSTRFTLSLNGVGNSLYGPISGALINQAGNNTLAMPVILAGNTQVASLKPGDKMTLNGNISGPTFGLTVYGDGDTELGGILGTTSGALTKYGNGTLTLSGSGGNTFLGATALYGGKTVLAKTGSAKAIFANTLTIQNGALVQYATGSTNPDMISNGVPVTINGAGQLDFNGVSDTISNVTIVATGATTNTTPILNTAGGGTLTIGTLAITPAPGYISRVDSGTGTLALRGNTTFNNVTTGRGQISGNLDLNGMTRIFTVNAGTGPDYDLDINAIISGGPGVGISNTTGRLRLSAANTYPGDTTVASGTIKYGISNAIPNGVGKGNVIVSGTLDMNGFHSAINGLSGAGSVDNMASGPATLTIGANDQNSPFTGSFRNTGGGALTVIKTGTGLLTIGGSSTFEGGLIIKSGTVIGTGGNNAYIMTSFGGPTYAGNVTLGDVSGTNAATLIAISVTYNGYNGPSVYNPITVQAGSSGVLTLGTFTNFNNTYNGPIALNNDLTIDAGGALGTVLLNNAVTGITGSRNITVTGSTTSLVMISSANTNFTGNLTVHSGVLRLGNAKALNVANTVAVNQGAVLNFYAYNQTIAGLNNGVSGGGVVSNSVGYNGAMTLTLGGSATNFFSGTLMALSTSSYSGNLALIVAMGAAGKQTLAGPGLYTGATTINSGTLVVSNSFASPVTINAGGVLGGTGPFYGQVTTRSGARIFPAGNVGTMTLTNGLFLSSGTTVDFEFKADLSANDLIDVTGGKLVFTNTAVNLYAEGSTSRADLTDGTYNLFKYVGTTSSITNLFVANPVPSKKYTFGVSGGYVQVTVSFDDAPQIATVAPSAVTPAGATLNGFLISTGSSDTAVSVYWGPGGDQGTNAAAAWAFTNDFGNNTYLPPAGLAYATNVTGLVADQQYTYRYYAINAAGAVWGAATNFGALPDPTVDNDAGATAITATNATLRGTLLNGTPATQVKIYWGTTDGGTTPGAWDQPAIDLGSMPLGSFSQAVTALQANKQYFYRTYATNDLGEAWASATTNFMTLGPGVSIDDPVPVTEGALSTTTPVTFTVTLSSVSALDVTVAYATSNGTALVSGNDYVAGAGSLTIPAGNLTGQIPFTVNGDDFGESNEVFYVNLSGWVNATNRDSQGMATIVNDDYTFYVRCDGQGNGDSSAPWRNAFDSLQKAFDLVPFSTATVVNVQASTGTQSYATCTRSWGGASGPLTPVTVSFLGGWQNVDTAPVQTGVSVVKDATASKPGIQLVGPTSYHALPKFVLIDRFVFTNVTIGIDFYNANSGATDSDVNLTVSNTVIFAQSNGISIHYPSGGTVAGSGGWAHMVADNLDIVAGLGGPGHGINIVGAWGGTRITASGIDPTTHAPRVSTITAPNGSGLNFVNAPVEEYGASFSNLVIYGCASNGIYLTAQPAQVTMQHCTIVDNGSDGVKMVSSTVNSSAVAFDNIFANNGGRGINMVSGPNIFTCDEGYDVFFNDDIQMNGAGKALAATTSTADPSFLLKSPKPAPWYWINSSSPAFKTASDGYSRGAYQNPLPRGVVFMIY